jgi:urease accessory protein
MSATLNLLSERAILGSVLLLGLAAALGLRAPAILGGLVIAAFGMAHGYAHGIEMPRTAHGLDFAAGFALATAALHAMGVLAATNFRRLRLDLVTRAAGVGIVIAGIGLIAGA